MFGKIMKLASAAKSIGDIIGGKADSDDVETVYEVGSDLLTNFVPAAAPVLGMVDPYIKPLAKLMNDREPGKGDELLAHHQKMHGSLEAILEKAGQDAASVREMSDGDFMQYVKETGY